MKGLIQNRFTPVLWVLALFVAVSCSHEADPPVMPDGEMMVNITLRTSRAADGYEDGAGWENYIDVPGGNYRIYFFTSDTDVNGGGKYIGQLTPHDIVAIDGTDYTEYFVLGKAPNGLLAHQKDFKVVVLANWPNYPADNDLTVGTTTIADICTDESAVFNQSVDKMPFYGVHQYADSNREFKPDVAEILDEPVTLLRALAKVEVVFDSANSDLNDFDGMDGSNVGIKSVSMSRYNKKGYCAPLNVFSQVDYGQGTNWGADFLNDNQLHVVAGQIEEQSELAFQKVSDANGKNTWIAYIPEFDNKNAGEKYSYINLKFTFQEEDSHNIYFANYTDGITSNDVNHRLNIERNNYYRFIVTVKGYFAVVVKTWDNVYNNEFNFGEG